MINKQRWITLPVVYSRPFDSKRFFERFWMNLSSPLTVVYNRTKREESLFWKDSSAGAIFPPKSHRSAFKLRSIKVKRFFSYLPMENPSKRSGASPRRKSKSHSIRATEMHNKIHTCQPQTVTLIASFWLDDVRPSSNQKNRFWGKRTTIHHR